MTLNTDQKVAKLEEKVIDMNTRLHIAENKIEGVEATINMIKDDTRWLRRTLTASIITALVGGVIGLIISLLTT